MYIRVGVAKNDCILKPCPHRLRCCGERTTNTGATNTGTGKVRGDYGSGIEVVCLGYTAAVLGEDFASLLLVEFFLRFDPSLLIWPAYMGSVVRLRCRGC